MTTFTNAQLQDGLVKFVDDIDDKAPTFTIRADDGQSSNNLSNTFNGKVTYVTEQRVDVKVYDTSVNGVSKSDNILITSEANIGDTVVATYKEPTAGNDIKTVTFDFSEFGGGKAVAATPSTIGNDTVYTSSPLILARIHNGIAKVKAKVTNNADNHRNLR